MVVADIFNYQVHDFCYMVQPALKGKIHHGIIIHFRRLCKDIRYKGKDTRLHIKVPLYKCKDTRPKPCSYTYLGENPNESETDFSVDIHRIVLLVL